MTYFDQMQFTIRASSGHHQVIGEKIALNDRLVSTNIFCR